MTNAPFQIPACEFCGEPLPPATGNGRPRRFCRDACRKAAARRRDYATWAAEHYAASPSGTSPVGEAWLVAGAGAPTDNQVLAVVQEAGLMVASLRRLSVEARSGFRPRCAGLADVLEKGLTRYFPV